MDERLKVYEEKMTKLMKQHDQAEYNQRKYNLQLTTCFR